MARLSTLRCLFLLGLFGFMTSLFSVHFVCKFSSWSCREIGVVGRIGEAYRAAEKAAQIRSPCRTRGYLNDVCKRYQQADITGSLCKPLCDSKEISNLSCLPVGRGKSIIVLATWGQRKIVLKVQKQATKHAVKSSRNVSINDFKEKTTASIGWKIGIYVNKSIIEPVLDRIVSECDVGGDGVLSGSELYHCHRLVQQPGLVLHTLLNRLVPEIYGSCGELLGYEFASPEALQASNLESRSWPHRVQLAMALLDYLQELEHTAYGTFYLCDMLWKNMGVTRDSNGKTVIKSIDNDCSYFGGNLDERVKKRLTSRHCSVDSDCRVCSCHVGCNKTTHTCSGKFSSNNLEVACRLILWNHQNYPGLLSNPPSWISSHLNNLITQCLESGKHTQHIPQDLIDQFYMLLWQSVSN